MVQEPRVDRPVWPLHPVNILQITIINHFLKLFELFLCLGVVFGICLTVNYKELGRDLFDILASNYVWGCNCLVVTVVHSSVLVVILLWHVVLVTRVVQVCVCDERL